MKAKHALLAFLMLTPACVASDPDSLAVWNVLPPRLSGSDGTLFFACKTATGLGPVRSIIADFTSGKSREVAVSLDDVAQLGKSYTPSLRKCAADCTSEVFLAREPEDADKPNPKHIKTYWYNFSLYLTQNGSTQRVGHFAIGNPTPSESGETYRFFNDLTVAPDASSFLLSEEDDEYYFFVLGNEHPSLILSPLRWGREYCRPAKAQ